ncbi:hypothetical protein NDU88_001140 [Pleurodeles waltl]|uniref:Uncharacterized protein n=1 Tax=Pleurodeles waltl TaxID=8319 RepID=A0AAV7KPH1_PLEWA|nr:hypothetical protein NDU88_001140 [Pleurodeles waltl]
MPRAPDCQGGCKAQFSEQRGLHLSAAHSESPAIPKSLNSTSGPGRQPSRPPPHTLLVGAPAQHCIAHGAGLEPAASSRAATTRVHSFPRHSPPPPARWDQQATASAPPTRSPVPAPPPCPSRDSIAGIFTPPLIPVPTAVELSLPLHHSLGPAPHLSRGQARPSHELCTPRCRSCSAPSGAPQITTGIGPVCWVVATSLRRFRGGRAPAVGLRHSVVLRGGLSFWPSPRPQRRGHHVLWKQPGRESIIVTGRERSRQVFKGVWPRMARGREEKDSEAKGCHEMNKGDHEEEKRTKRETGEDSD